MNEKELLLAKAKAKTLAHHFKKAAAHHEAKAAAHLKSHEAHKAHAEHHEEMMGKTDDADSKAHRKACMSFHKAQSVHHEKLHKAHTGYADHHKMMAAAHSEMDDHEKVFKLAGMEEEPLTTRPITPEVSDPVAKAAADKAAADKAAADKAAADKAAAGGTPTPAAPVVEASINDTIQKALDNKLTEAVSAAFERVLSSQEFNQKVDQAIAGKLLEKLGTSTVDSKIQTFPVPRAGDPAPSNGGPTKAEMAGLDPELAELCKVEF